jgi:hypothetical protein
MAIRHTIIDGSQKVWLARVGDVPVSVELEN